MLTSIEFCHVHGLVYFFCHVLHGAPNLMIKLSYEQAVIISTIMLMIKLSYEQAVIISTIMLTSCNTYTMSRAQQPRAPRLH